MEHVPACIALLRGPDFVFEIVNPEYAAIAPGIPMLGRRVRDVFPETEEFVVPRLREVLESGVPFRIEDQALTIKRHPSLESEVRYFSFSYTRVTDGETLHSNSILVLALETTAKKRAEAAREFAIADLEKQWRTFDTALSNTPDFIYTFDLDGRLTYANRALLTLWRVPLETAVGKNFFDLDYPPHLAERLQRQIQTVIRTKQSVRDQTPFTGPTGETRHYEYIFVPGFGSGGELEAVTGSTRDVTERLQAEEQEKEQQERFRESARLESLGVMAGGIAHDFNNLLTGILGNASLLVEVTNEPDRSLAKEVVLAAERAADLTKQMLAYSGKGHFVAEILELNAFIKENFMLARSTLARNVSVQIELTAEATYIKGDRAQIQQVLFNLIINASEAVGDKAGSVVVRTGNVHLSHSRFSNRLHREVLPGEYVFLEVRDNGIGIGPEALKRIFDPFYTTKFTGRGLGLASVLGIIKGHRGDIAVESELGVGTSFRILLPAAEGAEVAPTPKVDPVTFRGLGQVILVVDDDEIVQRFATAALQSAGFRVSVASNGLEALKALEVSPEIALVVLDLTMPVVSGEHAIPLIKAMRPRIPIILSSGYDQTEVTRRFLSFGIEGVLQKPYTASGLLSQVTETLRNGTRRGNF